MAIFGPKPWVTPLEKCQFFYFWTSCFYSLERCFFVVEYHKRHFSDLFWLKKKVGKMAIFGPKPWVNPSGKMSTFSTFQTFCFYSLERRFFVLEYHKRHFSSPILPKKKSLKNGHFWPKPWVNLFGKMSIFRVFELPVFIT